MRLDIKNASSHKDAPIQQMYDATGVFLFHVCNRYPGANHVVSDLIDQGFYFQLVDDLPEAPGALGYHDIDKDGRPYSKIAVNPSLQHGSDWLIGTYAVITTVTHEAGETVCNPIINIMRDMNSTTSVAQEICDPVEDTQYIHNGCAITNFVLPSWFNPFGKAPYDYLGKLAAPFTMTAGGYMIVREGGQDNQWTAKGLYGPDMPEWRKAVHNRAKLLGV